MFSAEEFSQALDMLELARRRIRRLERRGAPVPSPSRPDPTIERIGRLGSLCDRQDHERLQLADRQADELRGLADAMVEALAEVDPMDKGRAAAVRDAYRAGKRKFAEAHLAELRALAGRHRIERRAVAS